MGVSKVANEHPDGLPSCSSIPALSVSEKKKWSGWIDVCPSIYPFHAMMKCIQPLLTYKTNLALFNRLTSNEQMSLNECIEDWYSLLAIVVAASRVPV